MQANIDAFKISISSTNAATYGRILVGNMDGFQNDLEHPKKRRRRLDHKTPASARLVGDESLRGLTSVVSDDLWAELVGGSADNLSKCRPVLYLDCGH